MKILVLGGTGAMGVPLVKLLAEAGNTVYVTTRKNRKDVKEYIHYVQGDAHETDFLQEILKNQYDAIVDFMSYRPEEFSHKYKLFLTSTGHYISFSSARVYAESEEPLTEDSVRLLETVKDEEYLSTDEYALSKARNEDILQKSSFRNWTIIRPYITYNDERLQLGAYEKEYWLYRALHGRSIVFSKDIASKRTTLTYGGDVAKRIKGLLGKEEALSEIVQITSDESILWGDVLNIYLNTIETLTGIRPKVKWVDSTEDIKEAFLSYYQVKYDRHYTRVFHSMKCEELVKDNMGYVKVKDGLKACLTSLMTNNQGFVPQLWSIEAKLDRIVGEHTALSEIPGWRKKKEYLINRYL